MPCDYLWVCISLPVCTIRGLALRQIAAASQQNESKQHSIRQLRVPTINYNAEDYIDLIDWDATGLMTEPSFTIFMADNELQSYIKNGIQPSAFEMKLPCRTQAAERCVKLVTEASPSVCGELRRDG